MLQSKLAKRESKAEPLLSCPIEPQWRQIKASSTLIPRRCSHASALHQDSLYIYGGYDTSPTIFADMHAYSFKDASWRKVQQKGQLPGPRHSHTAIVFQDSIIMFGGMTNAIDNTNETHRLNLVKGSWQRVKTNNVPLAIDSHKACLLQDKMIVGMGYSGNQYNSKIYQLDCKTLSWKCLFNDANYKNNEYPAPRAHGSFNLYKQAIYIYGGKDFSSIFDDLWRFDLTTCRFEKVGLLQPVGGRFGHSGVILEGKLVVFGGTRGVTHQKNDLISIDLTSGGVKVYWSDSQEERQKQKEDCHQQPIMKKSRRDSAKKFGIQSKESQSGQSDQIHLSPNKYRNKLREVNFYNYLYDHRRKEGGCIKKTKRNPLLTELEVHEGESLNLTSSFDVLTNSILMTGNKLPVKEQREVNVDRLRQTPKARDNYSAELQGERKRMIIFGGGMHKISYNDIIVIELGALLKQ